MIATFRPTECPIGRALCLCVWLCVVMTSARDLGPRIVHALLPLPNKGGSDWRYAWIPVVGPIVGAVLAAGLYKIAF